MCLKFVSLVSLVGTALRRSSQLFQSRLSRWGQYEMRNSCNQKKIRAQFINWFFKILYKYGGSSASSHNMPPLLPRL